MEDRADGFMTKDELEKVYDDVFERIFKQSAKEVRELMAGVRSRAKDGAKVVQYTQGQHNAISMMFAAQKAEMLALLQARSQNRARMVDRIQQLEAKVATIEAKGVEYKGVWQAAQDYKRGNLVTFDGAIFHANVDTRAKPGSGSKAWTLAVKKGADAR